MLISHERYLQGEHHALPPHVSSLLSKVQMSEYFNQVQDIGAVLLQYRQHLHHDEKLAGIFAVLGYSGASNCFTKQVRRDDLELLVSKAYAEDVFTSALPTPPASTYLQPRGDSVALENLRKSFQAEL